MFPLQESSNPDWFFLSVHAWNKSYDHLSLERLVNIINANTAMIDTASMLEPPTSKPDVVAVVAAVAIAGIIHGR